MSFLTVSNVFENRKQFEDYCKNAGACKDEFRLLIKANTKQAFLNVIFANAKWVSEEIHEFKFSEKLDIVSVKNFSRINKLSKAKLSDGSFVFIDREGNPIENLTFNEVKRKGYSRFFHAKSQTGFFFIYCKEGITKKVSEEIFNKESVNILLA